MGSGQKKSVLPTAFLKLLFKMQLVIMLSMAVAVRIVTLVSLFIVGIIPISNIKFTKLLIIFFVKRVNIKIFCQKKALLVVVLSGRILWKKVSYTFKSTSRGLYSTVKILFFLFSFNYLHKLYLSHCVVYTKVNLG